MTSFQGFGRCAGALSTRDSSDQLELSFDQGTGFWNVWFVTALEEEPYCTDFPSRTNIPKCSRTPFTNCCATLCKYLIDQSIDI